MYVSFFILIFTFIIAFFLLLVLTFSGDVSKLVTAVESYLYFAVASAAIVWIRLPFDTSDVG